MMEITLDIEHMRELQAAGLDTSDATLMWSCTDPYCVQENAFLEVVVDKAIFRKYHYYIPTYTLHELLAKLDADGREAVMRSNPYEWLSAAYEEMLERLKNERKK